MNDFRHHIFTLRIAALVGVTALTGLVSAPLRAQDDPYHALRSYDGQSRHAIHAIRRQVSAAGTDKARLAAIETSLIPVLQDPSATRAAKQEACKFLYMVGTSRSVPVLRKILTDATLADDVRYALERNTDPAAGAALRAAALTARGRMRVGIVNSIGNRRDSLAVGTLRQLARSQDPELAGAAVTALGKIGTTDALAALRALPSGSSGVADAVLRCADRLVAGAKRDDAEATYIALSAKGNRPAVRVAAIRALAACTSAKAAPVALSALTDSDSRVRVGAAAVVASLPGAPTVQRAVGRWQTIPPDACVALLSGWGARREPAALSIAVRSTLAPDPAVRLAGIAAAGRIGRETVVEVLGEEVLPRGGEEAQAARQALASMPGAAAASAIIKLSESATPQVRVPLMWVLAERPGPMSTSALIAAAGGSVPVVAVEALKAIGSVGGSAEVDRLASLLSATPNDSVREAAAQAVVSCVQRSGNAEQAVEPVLKALPTASVAARTAMLGALAGIGGPKALEALSQAAISDNADVRRAAVQGLADTWNDSLALPTLLSVAKRDESRPLRVIALRGFVRLVSQDSHMSPEGKVASLSEAIRIAERAEEKRQAIGAMRSCRTAVAVQVLSGCLADQELFVDAAEAILNLASPQKQGDRELPAVRTTATAEALDRIIATATDADVKERARKLK